MSETHFIFFVYELTKLSYVLYLLLLYVYSRYCYIPIIMFAKDKDTLYCKRLRREKQFNYLNRMLQVYRGTEIK